MVEKKEKITKKKTSKKSSKVLDKKNRKGKNKIDKKIIFCGLSLVIIILIITLALVSRTKEKVVITLDNLEYTESDFNMYAYLIKVDYFGIDGTELDSNTLNTQLSNDNDMTIGEFLKEKTISKMKTTAAILRIAEENNITLNENHLKEIEAERKDFVEKLGGEAKYRAMLKKNQTTTEAYIEIAKVEKLYTLILDSLYKEDQRNDLTNEELKEYAKSYKKDYVKIKQIILLKKDLDTNKYLSETILNQKEVLAKQIAKMAQGGEDFDKLIKKYSDSYTGEIKSEYYLKSTLVDELKDSINLLDEGDISGVVSTDNAYHIIFKEKLDDSKLEDYYDSKREQKFIDDITANLAKIAIINDAYLEEIKVK